MTTKPPRKRKAVKGALTRERLVELIMGFVRPQWVLCDPKPTIDEIERSLNSENDPCFDLRADGTVWRKGNPVTVRELADAIMAEVLP